MTPLHIISLTDEAHSLTWQWPCRVSLHSERKQFAIPSGEISCHGSGGYINAALWI